ncbi:hypothetical protein ONZ45_g17485 [Pleurotus djamor]|nr:hypothetical protein ONZ45_g17485 [Pleurotus djamor]
MHQLSEKFSAASNELFLRKRTNTPTSPSPYKYQASFYSKSPSPPISSHLISPTLSYSLPPPLLSSPSSDALSTILINFDFISWRLLLRSVNTRHFSTAHSQVESTSRAISIKNGLIEVTLRYSFELPWVQFSSNKSVPLRSVIPAAHPPRSSNKSTHHRDNITAKLDNSQPDVATSDDNNRVVAVDNNETKRRVQASRPITAPLLLVGITNGLEYTFWLTHPHLPTPQLLLEHPVPVHLEDRDFVLKQSDSHGPRSRHAATKRINEVPSHARNFIVVIEGESGNARSFQTRKTNRFTAKEEILAPWLRRDGGVDVLERLPHSTSRHRVCESPEPEGMVLRAHSTSRSLPAPKWSMDVTGTSPAAPETSMSTRLRKSFSPFAAKNTDLPMRS